LNKYYRQNLHNYPSPVEREERLAIEAAESSDSDVEVQQLSRRENGERGRALTNRANLGMVGVTAEKRKEVQAAEKRSRKVEQREQRKTEWYNNKQSNMQKHFRVSSPHSVPQGHWLIFFRILCSSDLEMRTWCLFQFCLLLQRCERRFPCKPIGWSCIAWFGRYPVNRKQGPKITPHTFKP
jgi:pre-60S factor REI1